MATEVNIDQLIVDINKQIESCFHPDIVSWDIQQGVLISKRQAEVIRDVLKHHRRVIMHVVDTPRLNDEMKAAIRAAFERSLVIIPANKTT